MRSLPLQRKIALILKVMAIVVTSPVAHAQTFVGVGLSGHPPAPPTSFAPSATTEPSSAHLPTLPPTVLRHLPATLDGLRLDGEIGDLAWPVYLTEAQAGSALRFRVGYLSAVSVLPDASQLQLRVNGRVVTTETIDASQELKSVVADIPPGLMKPGYNALSIKMRQRHRVDCSIAATYELWTQIDPSATGLEIPASTGSIGDIADLPALLPNADGSMTVHVVLAGKTNPQHVQRLIRATEAIALKGRFFQPAVTFAPLPDDPSGLDLVLGTRAALSQVPRLDGLLGDTGAVATLVPPQGDKRPMLIVTGSNDAEVDQAIDSLDRSVPLVGSPEGVLAAADFPARKAAGGDTLRLANLGVEDQEFSGRFFRKSINVELPADMLASDYGRGTFDFAGGYAAGLSSGAQVRIDVNGRNSGIIKLPDADGDVFKHNQLFLPLGLMKPGFNRIDIFAETPRALDATCTASDAKRLLFLGASELRLPALARVERMPDLAQTTSGGLPFTNGHAHLVVPKPDRETLGAALSLVTRIAVSAGHAVPFSFGISVPTDDDGSTLVVSPARALDASLLTQVGLDPKAVEKAWRDFAQPPAPGASRARSYWWLTNNTRPLACQLAPRGQPVKAVAAPLAPAAPEAEDLVETWAAERRESGWRNMLATTAARVARGFETARNALPLPAIRRPHANDVDPAATLLIAQEITGSADHTTTLVTAATSADLQSSLSCLFDPRIWSKVHGRLASLDASSGEIVATDATSFRYRSSGATSMRNYRLVVAGWFSLNPLAFVMTGLLTAFCLSGTTLWFVRGVGRRPE